MTDLHVHKTVFLTTVGEDITFDALDTVQAFTPFPHHLIIWYDACGRGVNNEFLNKLRAYSDDIILVKHNKGLASAVGFALLYIPDEWIVYTCSDLILTEDYFERLIKPFNEVDNLVVSGEGWRDFPQEYVVSDFDIGIDGTSLYRRSMLNKVGGVSPSFYNNAPFHQELHRRAVSMGYNFATCKGVCVHGGTQHEGVSMLGAKYYEQMDKNCKAYLEMEKMNYKGYNWWSDEFSGLRK